LDEILLDQERVPFLLCRRDLSSRFGGRCQDVRNPGNDCQWHTAASKMTIAETGYFESELRLYN
jgi:hypothetical protein